MGWGFGSGEFSPRKVWSMQFLSLFLCPSSTFSSLKEYRLILCRWTPTRKVAVCALLADAVPYVLLNLWFARLISKKFFFNVKYSSKKHVTVENFGTSNSPRTLWILLLIHTEIACNGTIQTKTIKQMIGICIISLFVVVVVEPMVFFFRAGRLILSIKVLIMLLFAFGACNLSVELIDWKRCRYLKIVKSERLEISQPALNPNSTGIHHKITVRRKGKKFHTWVGRPSRFFWYILLWILWF